jgi:hypothetical protein
VKPRLAHIVNTVSPSDSPALFKTQELTLRTMRVAKEKAANEVDVELLSAQYEDAVSVLPEGIRATKNLESNAALHRHLETKKRLPLLREILSRLKESEDATHFIYTNLDICLVPDFYSVVAAYLAKGNDALVINRRRISAGMIDETDLRLLYAEAGIRHLGYDCFIFSRQLLEKFILADIYISTPPAGSDLFYNLFTFAENPVLLTEKHLTFHVGKEMVKAWGNPALNRHNQSEYRKMLRELKPHMQIAKFPGAGYGFFKRHFKWLMNPTLHYPTMASVDFKQWSSKRKSPGPDELAGHRYFEWIARKTGFRDGE